MLPFVLMLIGCYLAALICEKKYNDRALASFRWVIHVNGIRGKTSVCRLIDARLRGAGLRVFTKTTGTDAACIDTSGTERPIRRLGGANILEQLAVIRRAYREGAEVLILECMAVRPELQAAAQQQIVKAKVGVITNVRYDHIFEMGESLDEIAGSLSATIPDQGTLFTADEAYFPFFQEKCREKGTRAVLCRPREGMDENEAVAEAVARSLGVEGAAGPLCRDFGARHLYRTEGRSLLNLFSANDPQSSLALLRQYGGDGGNVTMLYNNRADRPDRLLLFIRHFFPAARYQKIVVMGENRALAVRLLRRAGCGPVEQAADWRAALRAAEGEMIVGLGNIKGQAYELLQYLEGEDANE